MWQNKYNFHPSSPSSPHIHQWCPNYDSIIQYDDYLNRPRYLHSSASSQTMLWGGPLLYGRMEVMISKAMICTWGKGDERTPPGDFNKANATQHYALEFCTLAAERLKVGRIRRLSSLFSTRVSTITLKWPAVIMRCHLTPQFISLFDLMTCYVI